MGLLSLESRRHPCILPRLCAYLRSESHRDCSGVGDGGGGGSGSGGGGGSGSGDGGGGGSVDGGGGGSVDGGDEGGAIGDGRGGPIAGGGNACRVGGDCPVRRGGGHNPAKNVIAVSAHTKDTTTTAALRSSARCITSRRCCRIVRNCEVCMSVSFQRICSQGRIFACKGGVVSVGLCFAFPSINHVCPRPSPSLGCPFYLFC